MSMRELSAILTQNSNYQQPSLRKPMLKYLEDMIPSQEYSQEDTSWETLLELQSKNIQCNDHIMQIKPRLSCYHKKSFSSWSNSCCSAQLKDCLDWTQSKLLIYSHQPYFKGKHVVEKQLWYSIGEVKGKPKALRNIWFRSLTGQRFY